MSANSKNVNIESKKISQLISCITLHRYRELFEFLPVFKSGIRGPIQVCHKSK